MNKFGTTSSSIAFATQNAIQHNMKVLLITTSYNDSLVKESFWVEKKKGFSLFENSSIKKSLDTSGIVGLDRMLRSNKMTPDLITDYAKIVLSNRLEILMGVEGDIEQYNQVKENYAQIISLAGRYYDMVVVDVDKQVGEQVEKEILKASKVIVALVPQRAKKIEKIKELLEKDPIVNNKNAIMTIGKYMDNSKYNAKNITRNLLRRKELINIIPYNNLFFEATQEGTVIDLFLNFMRLKDKDENYMFIESIKKLNEDVKNKIQSMQLMV